MPKISELSSGAPAQDTDELPGRRAAGNIKLTVKDLKDANGTLAVTTVATTTYTVQASDFGKLILFTASSAVTVTVPTGLGAGFQCAWKQKGTGQLTFAAGAGATLESYNGALKSSGRYAVGSLLAEAANVLTLTGTIANT